MWILSIYFKMAWLKWYLDGLQNHRLQVRVTSTVCIGNMFKEGKYLYNLLEEVGNIIRWVTFSALLNNALLVLVVLFLLVHFVDLIDWSFKGATVNFCIFLVFQIDKYPTKIYA